MTRVRWDPGFSERSEAGIYMNRYLFWTVKGADGATLKFNRCLHGVDFSEDERTFPSVEEAKAYAERLVHDTVWKDFR